MLMLFFWFFSFHQGNLEIPTHLHFLRLFIQLSTPPAHVEELMYFLSDKTLLHVPIGCFPPAKLAGAVYYLAQLTSQANDCWPTVLRQWTGLRLADLQSMIITLHSFCFCRNKIIDHRNIELKAVNERYEKAIEQLGLTLKVEDIEPPSDCELTASLAVVD